MPKVKAYVEKRDYMKLKTLIMVILPLLAGCQTAVPPEDPKCAPILSAVEDRLTHDGWLYYREAPVNVWASRNKATVTYYGMSTNPSAAPWAAMRTVLRHSSDQWIVVSHGLDRKTKDGNDFQHAVAE